jgi:hypothetical protein
MPTSVIIVDDFLQDPHVVREAALKLTYPVQDAMFAGRNSSERLAISGLAEQVSKLVGENIVPIEPLQSHAKCRITLAEDRGRSRVHVDRSHWSGILYLSRMPDCTGGTEFYRHRRTGIDRWPINREELAAIGMNTAEDVRREIAEKDGNDPEKWEQTMQVPMRFNRLLLLRPWLWHTAGPGFGANMDTGRLVYLMFFAASSV